MTSICSETPLVAAVMTVLGGVRSSGGDSSEHVCDVSPAVMHGSQMREPRHRAGMRLLSVPQLRVGFEPRPPGASLRAQALSAWPCLSPPECMRPYSGKSTRVSPASVHDYPPAGSRREMGGRWRA